MIESSTNRFQRIKDSFTLLFLLTTPLLSFFPVNAQSISSDNTLNINSRVTRTGNRWQIDGGTQAGGNLFHSFSRFSVNQNHVAAFNNSPEIQNIIARVTGNSPSMINGTIGADGEANLFLINTHGLSFGRYANLNIGGSFLGTTANSILFNDGIQFLSSITQKKPILSVHKPVGLNFTQQTAGIQLQNNGHKIFLVAPNSFPVGELSSPLFGRELTPGLRVSPGKTFALIGGGISLDGGIISAKEGQVELGSIKKGKVFLSQPEKSWNFIYDVSNQFDNILITNSSLVDASSRVIGSSSGSINLQGKNIALQKGSVIISQNLGPLKGGDINVNTTGELTLNGTSFGQVAPFSNDQFQTPIIRTQITIPNGGSGHGGDIRVKANQLKISDGARIGTTVLPTGVGRGGSLNVTVNNDIQLSGFSPINPLLASQIIAETNSFAFGAAGDINVEANLLKLILGANIVSTANIGNGIGGNTTIKVRDTINIEGENPFTEFPSVISTSTVLSSGDAQNIFIEVPRLILMDGGRIGAPAFTSGNAGNLTVIAKDFVIVRGAASSVNPSLIISSANQLTQRGAPSLLPSGNSGSINIKTPFLIIADKGEITVRNDGPGDAGQLNIQANTLLLSRNGSISASSQSGIGGNINLKISDLIFLNGESLISSEAGGLGQGGNITIAQASSNSKLILLSSPFSNSDIIANAFEGPGGRININAPFILGFQLRTRAALERIGSNNPNDITTNDISAISQEGGASLDGNISFLNPSSDPSQDVATLPESINQKNLVTQSCSSSKDLEKRDLSDLNILGRGGIVSIPSETLLSGTTKTNDWIKNSLHNLELTDNPTKNPHQLQSTRSIIEAQYWHKNSEGVVELIASKKNQTLGYQANNKAISSC